MVASCAGAIATRLQCRRPSFPRHRIWGDIMAVDQDQLMQFLGPSVGDRGATMAAGGVLIGERLGLYRALAGKPQTPQELADATGTDARYVDEWARGQAAGGYIQYDATS